MTDSARVIVIGSGPAGAAAAVALCDRGIDVLVLEAGRDRSFLGLTAKVRGITVAKRRPPLRARAGVTFTGDPTAQVYEELAPGGLSNHWSCAVPRFSHEDFADAERAGEAHTWPIGYADLAPWYERVEPWLEPSGSDMDSPQLPAGKVSHRWELAPAWTPVAEEARRSGRGIVPMPYAFGAETTLTLGGTVFNAFVRLVRPRERASKLAVRYGARALRLEWSPGARRVEAVIVRDATTRSESRIPCRAVVLAAGAINSAQILLESTTADFPAGLGNTHGVLGRYLHDHPLGKLEIELAAPVPVHPPTYVTRLALEHSQPLYAAACMQWSGVSALVRSVLRGRPGRLATIGFSVFGTMEPTLENGILLDPSRERVEGASALTLHIRYAPEAVQALEQARDQLLEILSRVGWQPRTRLWRIEPVLNSVHYGGTCRMHASPRFGMADRWSRLHAVPNVAVADSAVFTTGPEKNPVLTAMALSARASDRLASDLQAGDL